MAVHVVRRIHAAWIRHRPGLRTRLSELTRTSGFRRRRATARFSYPATTSRRIEPHASAAFCGGSFEGRSSLG
jgi:hypothetical protein